VGLVLSGGGAKGFAYIGLLKVIQEAGLPIDYIGGTSIGSIVAGFYALGYHPDTMASIIGAQNWDHLIKDKIDRKYIAYEEKEFGEKFIVTLPVIDKKVAIAASLYQGQEIDLLLNHYFSPAYNIRDFNDLQTPFLCIGTDLLKGDEVVIDEGYLPTAIRASMSIPGYFSPVKYMDYYLVDGGVVNNYPAKNVKEMGADIIVGGDVQSGLTKSIDDLNSLTAILDQIISYHRVKANEVGYAMTDLYVNIPLDFSMMDFESYEEIIAVGDSVGRAHFDEIKALADSLNTIEYKPIKKYDTTPLDSIFINNVKITGSEKMSPQYFRNIFDEYEHSWIQIDGLEKTIRLMFGTRFFQKVGYELEPAENDQANLIIKVTDADPGYISAGVHYDNNYDGSILVNGTFRNVLGKRTKLLTDLVLGVNPRLRALYMLDNANKPGFGVKLDFYNFNFDDYNEDVKINTFTFNNYGFSVFANSSLKNSYSIRLGFEYQYFQFKQNVVIDTTLENFENFNSYGNIFLTFASDTRDKNYYPTKGFIAQFSAKYIIPLSDNWSRELFTNSAVLYMRYDQNIKLSKRLVLRPGLFLGTTLRQSQLPPTQNWFAVGGLNPQHYIDNHVDFTGVRFIQSFGLHTAIVRLKLQYNFFKDMYLIPRADAGVNEMEIEDVFQLNNVMVGYGLTYGYNSFIGPIELTVMDSNISGLMWFLNIGYWF
jgi:NTE family protein